MLLCAIIAEKRLTGKCHTSRSEAAQIPTLLVAAKSTAAHEVTPEHYDETQLDQEDGTPYNNDYDLAATGGYYSDGAYVAAPPIGPQRPPPRPTTQAQSSATSQQHQLLDADTAFHASLIRRFRTHRDLLRGRSDSHSGNPDTPPLSRRHLMESPPNGLQLAELDYESTFEMLAEATQLVQEPASRSTMQIQRLGAWVWALLAKVEELGTLSSEEVGFVRELGKAAIEVIRRRVMGEDDVVEVQIRRHEEEDVQKPSQAGIIPNGRGDANASAVGPHASTVSTGGIDRGRPFNSRPPRRRRNSSSDVSESDELKHSRTLESTSPQPEIDEQESLEMARRRLLERVAQTVPEEEQQLDRGDGIFQAEKMVDSAVMVPGEEDGEVVESMDDADNKAVEVAVPEEAFEEVEKRKVKQMNAMLDMILTIVGEEYGQRDLLVARDVLWDI